MVKVQESGEINNVKRSLNAFAPDLLTDAYIKAIADRRKAEQDRKVAYNVALITIKANTPNITDKIAMAQAEHDPKVESADAQVIEAQGREISAKLKREDHYERNGNIKKIANLIEAEMKLI